MVSLLTLLCVRYGNHWIGTIILLYRCDVRPFWSISIEYELFRNHLFTCTATGIRHTAKEGCGKASLVWKTKMEAKKKGFGKASLGKKNKNNMGAININLRKIIISTHTHIFALWARARGSYDVALLRVGAAGVGGWSLLCDLDQWEESRPSETQWNGRRGSSRSISRHGSWPRGGEKVNP